nr:hypothetical protein CFP56_30961 [Quercus suber]
MSGNYGEYADEGAYVECFAMTVKSLEYALVHVRTSISAPNTNKWVSKVAFARENTDSCTSACRLALSFEQLSRRARQCALFNSQHLSNFLIPSHMTDDYMVTLLRGLLAELALGFMTGESQMLPSCPQHAGRGAQASINFRAIRDHICRGPTPDLTNLDGGSLSTAEHAIDGKSPLRSKVERLHQPAA